MKKMILLLTMTLLSFVVSLSSFAQQQSSGSIECYGVVVDSVTNEPVVGAVINEIRSYDNQMQVKSYVTDNKGKFGFKFLPALSNRIEISALGYKLFLRNLPCDINTEKINCGIIKLSQDVYKLDEVVVSSRMEMFRVSGDTTLYFPRAAKTMQGDAVIEILKMMPGVRVTESGLVYINGKVVERTYLNNKLIFGEDPTKALNMIDAKDAQLIQAYDEVDEKDVVLSGKQNARKRKVLNIITFKDVNVFMSADLKAEYGCSVDKDNDDNRKNIYEGGINSGRFSEASQISLLFDIRNKSLSNIGSIDNNWKLTTGILDISGSISEKAKYKISYSHNSSSISSFSTSVLDYFKTNDFDSQQIISENSNNDKSNSNKIGVSYSYTKDKFVLDSKLETNLHKAKSKTDNVNISNRDNMEILSMIANNASKQSSFDISPSLALTQRLNKGSLQFAVRMNISNTSGDVDRYDTIRDKNEMEVVNVLNYDKKNPKWNINSFVTYRFNIGKSVLKFRTSVKYDNMDLKNIAYNEVIGKLDSVRSINTDTKILSLDEKIDYKLVKNKKYTISAGITYSNVFMDVEDKLPDNLKYDRYFYAFLPYISYEIHRNSKNNWNFSVSMKQLLPDWRDLSTRINDNNQLFVTTGNPELESGRAYSGNMTYEFMSDKSSTFSFGLIFDAYFDQVVQDRTYYANSSELEDYNNYKIVSGATLFRPINGKESYSVGGNLAYDTRIKLLKSMFRISAEYEYSNPQYSVNKQLFHTQRHSSKMKTTLTTNFSNVFKLKFTDEFKYAFQKNKDSDTNEEFFNTANFDIRWDITHKTELDLNYGLEYKTNDYMDNSITNHLLNASFAVRLGKNNNGKISFNAYDILNKSKHVQTNVTDQYIINEKGNKILTSFYTISLEWKFAN